MLYICATPIGNMNDITLRALEILNKADVILCEDTRNSLRLLNYHNIVGKKLVALHEHNENEVSTRVIEWLKDEQIIIQISDAGTPGISDPGARLCNLAFEYGFVPHPLPGACAYLSLVSISGLIDTSNMFYGFLPNKSTQRQKQLLEWKDIDYAIVIYESPHRIIECINDIVSCLGGNRMLVIGRELTKQFETIMKLSASEYVKVLANDKNQLRGEFVINILPIVANKDNELTTEHLRVLNLVAEELPAKKAVNLVYKILGGNKESMYQYLLSMK